MTTTSTSLGALPTTYLVWLTGLTVSRLGDAVLSFALVWAAAGSGVSLAALVVTLNGLPRVVLLLVGGAVADRAGARRLMISGEAALLGLTAALALAVAAHGTPRWLLLSAALTLGTVSAFCLPASGSMPRRLVHDEQLGRALALRQGSSQAVLMVAAPIAGLLVARVGLTAIVWATVMTLGVSLCILLAVPERAGQDTDEGRGAPARLAGLELFDGFRVVARTPGLRALLLLTGAGAALILPVVSILVPSLGRSAGWGSGTTGSVAGAVGAGVVCAALLASRRRSQGSVPGAAPALGLVVSALGALTLAAAPSSGDAGHGVALAGALVFGLGNGAFVARLAPLVLGSAPRTHLARVQALVGLVQLVPVMVSNLALGAVAERGSPGWALGLVATGLAVCAICAPRRVAGGVRA